MYVVVCYDVVENARRTRLMKALRGRLEHVQKSVFEGELADDAWPGLQSQMLKTIDPAVDTVRVYWLCGRCRSGTEILGTGVYVSSDDADEIL